MIDVFTAEVSHLLGLEAPKEDEVAVARELLGNAPAGTSPLEIARYISRLTRTNEDGELYIAEWRRRANPLIVEMFRATGTRPSGDQTPWCAAFVNWCLTRAGKHGTQSAESRSFRDAGRAADPPQEGDVVVFGACDAAGRKSKRGHVAFFLHWDASFIRALGGNQHDRVMESAFGRTCGQLEYLSCRSTNSLA